MRKFLILFLLLLLPSVNALYDNYVVCQNRTVEDMVTTVSDSIRFNSTNTIWVLDDTANKILIYNRSDVFDNYVNITLSGLPSGTLTGLALNRSSYSNKYFWVTHLQTNSTLKLNSA